MNVVEINKIFIERKFKLIIEDKRSNKCATKQHIGTIIKNIENLGFTFSKNIIDIISNYSKDDLTSFYYDIVSTLKEIVGVKRKYKPMYPNFPSQVMDMSECELYVNAILHYFGNAIGYNYIPISKTEECSKLISNHKLKVIDVGTIDQFYTMISDLIQSKTSISENDKSHIKYVLENCDFQLPNKIYHKEILGFIVSIIMNLNTVDNNILAQYFNTATDVLRFITALSDGDISLASNTKYKKFSRSERKFILSLLDSCNNLIDDMCKYKNKWIRIGEIIHPWEYAKKYKNACNAFNIIRNQKHIVTFNTKIEQAIKNNNIEIACNLLIHRAGEFARRIDKLLRLANNNRFYIDYIINSFKSIVDNISTPVLLQVINHFQYRNVNDNRIVMPKGSVALARILASNIGIIEQCDCDLIIEICNSSLINRFSTLSDLNNVYLDEKLKDYIVPFSQRTASRALKTIVRGSKLDIDDNNDNNILRFFVWWKDLNSNDNEYLYDTTVDIDLSAVMFDENWNYMEHISYTNLKSKYQACHSGDLTSAKFGASEYIDIDMSSFKNYGCRYIVMNLYSYTGQSFNKLPECVAGWMTRNKLKHGNNGKIFEPKTVQNKFDVTTSTTCCIPLIIDLEEYKVIWCDIVNNNEYMDLPYNNIENNIASIIDICKNICSTNKYNLYDLFKLHCIARNGCFIDDIDKADTIFSIEKGITPFDIEVIMNKYLI